MDWLWLVGRAVFGLYFVYSGLNHFIQFQGLKQYASYKGVPAPGLSVVVTGLMLLAGGLSILTAYWVEWGLYLLVIFLVVSAFLMHNFWKVEDQTAKAGEKSQFLKNIALAAAALMLLSITNWTW
ncbi:putative membrane protein YphA (DoxX/SURF4 family) [Neobacillus niacini]|uniref:DoxX family protein n=1 Tax=Neobacillus niacini TaxID=86668 RepID=UPI0010452E00|nr:DoxX family protein [Neobacillus niacini]MDR7077305.1 putative membrane protein YphA (DoxX/SURF4 family) [Neobacillus niacini]